MKTENNTPTFERSPETVAILELLKNRIAFISYESMSKVAGVEVTGGSNYFQAAKKMAVRDHGILYETVRKVGARLVSSNDTPTVASKSLKKVNRECNRGRMKLRTAKRGEMSEEAVRKADSLDACLGGLSMFTKHNQRKKIQEAAVDANTWKENAEVFVKSLRKPKD